MKRTNKYGMVYFEKDDYTNAQYEMQRWETLDAQLASLFNIMGNGVLSGWNILAGDGLSATITAGTGHVSFVSTTTTESVLLTSLTPSTRNYIYAQLTADSYWTKDVSFVSFVYELTDQDTNLYLGYVDTDLNSVTVVNTDGRKELGFVALINSAVAAHKHTGGTDSPSPINLASEVQGILGQENLPDLDASIVKTGTFDPNRLPLIDHITGLNNVGTLTHAQLDSFVEALSISGNQAMGEVSTADLLQLILALKHAYPDIDKYLINELAFIPGISPDEMIDTVNTTAVVDTRPASEGGQHTITGVATTGFNTYTRIWDTEDDYSTADKYNVLVNGDSVSLDVLDDTIVVDDFSSLGSWNVSTNDLSSISANLSEDPTTYVDPPYSAKLSIGSEQVEIKLLVVKTLNAQDWSSYNFLTFYIKTDSVEHGDLFFYLTDSVYGTQNSYTKVLDRNTPSINVETLEGGWQEVSVDISSFQRSNINKIGFYISTQQGWDTTKPFDLNIDRISLTNGNVYDANGYLRVIFGSDMFYNFWRLRWDAIIPDSANGTAIEFRTRVANTQADLLTAPWSAYMSVSGSNIVLPTASLYKYIQIEAYFTASNTLDSSPSLLKIYLDFYVVDVDNSFTFNTQNDWEKGSLYNIDTNSYPNSIVIKGTEDVGSMLFGANGNVYQLDSNLQEMYKVSGSMLPRSTYQILNNIPPSLGLVTGVSRGNNGNIWMSDTDNDRVVEVDRSGGLVRGFFGSYLVENVDPSVTTTTATTAATATVNPQVLQAIYNYNKGYLYVIFNRDLTSDDLAVISFDSIRVGATVFRLGSYTFGYAQNGFDNVLSATITGADQTLLSYMTNQEAPSILIQSPYEQQRINSSSLTVNFIINNFILGSGGSANRIRVVLDNSLVQDIYSTSVSYSGLSSGAHTITAVLVNADGSVNTNIEALAEGSFVINVGAYTLPYVSILTPKPNQIYSSSPVAIEFKIENFPIIPSGQHLRYIVDTDAPVDYYSTDPIVLDELIAGQHSLSIYLVDETGSALGYTYGSSSVDFIVGLNSLARVKLYGSIGSNLYNIYVDVANLIFSDVYAPFDVQYIPQGNDSANPNGKESILIGKLTNNYIMSKIG